MTDQLLQSCLAENFLGCEQQLSRWMHQFKSIHLKVRAGYSSADRARFVASAARRCPRILQICQIIMQQGALIIHVGPNDRRAFLIIEDLPQVSLYVFGIAARCATIAIAHEQQYKLCSCVTFEQEFTCLYQPDMQSALLADP